MIKIRLLTRKKLIKFYFATIISVLNTFLRKGKYPELDPHPDPYFWLMYSDADTGGPKTYGYGTLISDCFPFFVGHFSLLNPDPHSKCESGSSRPQLIRIIRIRTYNDWVKRRLKNELTCPEQFRAPWTVRDGPRLPWTWTEKTVKQDSH